MDENKWKEFYSKFFKEFEQAYLDVSAYYGIGLLKVTKDKIERVHPSQIYKLERDLSQPTPSKDTLDE